MLTKIKFDVYNKDNIHINFKGPRECYIDENVTEINTIECLEYCRIDISLFSDYNNSYIEVTSIDDDNKEDKDIIINNNQTKTICNYDICDNKLVPGYYCYKLYLPDRVLEGLYFIRPSSIEWESLINLRYFLNSYVSGLALNMYNQRKTNKFKNDTLLSPNIYNTYLYLQTNKRILINNIEQIIKEPICDIKKKYKESHYQGKLDTKSQKWFAKKGLSRNANIYIPEVVYSKHAVTDIIIPENMWVKKIITNIIYWVFNIENSFYVIMKNLREELDEKKVQKKRLSIQLCSLEQEMNAGGTTKYQVKNQIDYIDNDMIKIKEKLELVDMNLADMKKLKSLLISYNNETWLKEINKEVKITKPTIRLLKDPRYNMLYDFYVNIVNPEKEESKIKGIRFAYKDTPTLFEYYVVVMTIEILKDMKYVWTKGWIADDIRSEVYNGTIPTEEPFIFINENKDIRAELYYEKEIHHDYEIMNGDKSDFVRGSSPHYKPDILIAIFNNITDEYLTSIIIEVKCFKSKYLIMKEPKLPSKVIEQVRSYYMLGYYDINKKDRDRLTRDAISKVIVVYPKQNKTVNYPYDDMNIDFIQIEANSDNIYEHCGYEELKISLEEILNNY